MPTPRLRLGQLLVDAGLLSQQDLDEVLALQKTDGRRLGTLLVERGHINETQLTQILSHQLSVPWVSLLHIEFSRQLLNLVPHHVAERFCVVPIYVRHVRGQGQTLYVAMDDPSNEEGLRACSEHSGLPVKAMIAPPSDIRDAIRVYYDVQVGAPAAQTPLTEPAPIVERDTTPDGTRPEVAPETAAAAALEETPAAPFVAAAVEAPQVEVAEVTVSSLELKASEAERSPKPQPSPTRSAPKTPPPPTQEAAPIVEAEAPPPMRGKMPSAPDVPPPPTLPDPGAQSPQLEEVAAKTRVSIVEARPLPPPSERLRRVLEIADDPQPSTLGEGELVPSSQPVDTIPEPRGRAPRMISLTLLDGTTISLPAPRKQKQRVTTLAQPAGMPIEEELPPSTLGAEDDRAGLTARDLVAALRAVCHGADAKEILGPNLRWEAIAAALLSVLLRKGLVADWEFVDELKKI
ncbi:hypothetical protein [Polyangium spumosum]|uniref:Type II secretion system protein GspE N-terminal domain-containing protein n=1 Tax=Polyangium spumosum TaxID=889282 RepID=A0A6N7PNN0_9BACT|nr:hypothetical protein [Polyangium spumosum]MRG91745.1 hypothetical protein [Polyangium spumosum]